MTTIIRNFWLLALCILVTGCSSYREAAIYDAGDLDDGQNEAGVVDLSPGDDVRVTLKDGTEIQGVFVSASHDSLTIDIKTTTTTPSNDGISADQEMITFEKGAIPRTAVATLERRDTNVAGTIGVTILSVGLVTAVGFGIYLSNEFQ